MALRKSKAAKMVNELLEASSSKTKKKIKAKRAPVEKPAATATAAAATPAVSAEESNAYIVIDYPTEGEIISGLHYAIRIGASEPGSVEISFNSGDWQACRPGAGYWWFDWGYFEPGAYKIVARLIDESGRVIMKSDVRKVQVA